MLFRSSIFDHHQPSLGHRRFIFDLLDHAAAGDEALDQFEFNAFMGKDNHKGLNTVVGSGSGGSKLSQTQSQSQSQDQSLSRKNKKSGLREEADDQKKVKLPSKGFGSKK